jgi:biotin carboxylase
MSDALLVLYDHGAASPGDLVVGLAGLGTVVFVVGDSEHVRRLDPVLTRLGRVVRLTGDGDADLALLRPLRPAAILTFSEPMLPTAAVLADALELPFHPPATTRLLTDKIAQRNRLRARGVDDTRCGSVTSLDGWPAVRDRIGLPAVVKPVHGVGSRNTYLVRDDETARRVLRAVLAERPTEPVVVEEFLAGRPSDPFGDYVSVESVCFPHTVQHLAVTGKFPLVAPFRECGRFWPAALPPGTVYEVLTLTTAALHALDVRGGLTHTEIKLTDRGPRIIEVNGRLGGHVHHLARQTWGVNLIELAGRLALGATRADPLPAVSRVHFQHNTPAPTATSRLLEAHGAADVRRIPGVAGYRLYHRPGDRFPADVGTRYLDLLWGNTPDHRTMIATADEAAGTLSFDFEFTDGMRRLSANTLRGRES